MGEVLQLKRPVVETVNKDKHLTIKVNGSDGEWTMVVEHRVGDKSKVTTITAPSVYTLTRYFEEHMKSLAVGQITTALD